MYEHVHWSVVHKMIINMQPTLFNIKLCRNKLLNTFLNYEEHIKLFLHYEISQ